VSPSVVSVRRDGESVSDVRDAHPARGGSEPGGRGGARDRSFVDGESGDQRDVGAFLVERGVDYVAAEEDYDEGHGRYEVF